MVSHLLVKDEIFARVGGEEFAIILPETSLSAAKEVGEEVRSHIQNCQFEFEKIEIPVTVSVGVVEIGRNETTKRLYAHADKALYAAKRNGRNCVATGTGTDGAMRIRQLLPLPLIDASTTTDETARHRTDPLRRQGRTPTSADRVDPQTAGARQGTPDTQLSA